MKAFVLVLVLAFGLALKSHAELQWLTDETAATAKAQSESKLVLLDFTGSDWCGWCKRLKAEVFDHPDFASYAQQHLVMVEVDFPQHYQSPEQRAHNEALAARYNVTGYPTIIVLNGAGEKVGQLGYTPGGPSAFIGRLNGQVPGSASLGQTAGTGATATPVPIAQPSPSGLITSNATPPIVYGDLKLKGISGGKNQRLALINNQTFMAGESASVKVKDGKVKVTCKEIAEDYALVEVDGQERQLKFSTH